MLFIDQGNKIPDNPNLPNRLIVITLMEFIGIVICSLLIGGYIISLHLL